MPTVTTVTPHASTSNDTNDKPNASIITTAIVTGSISGQAMMTVSLSKFLLPSSFFFALALKPLTNPPRISATFRLLLESGLLVLLLRALPFLLPPQLVVMGRRIVLHVHVSQAMAGGEGGDDRVGGRGGGNERGVLSTFLRSRSLWPSTRSLPSRFRPG